MVGRNRLLGRGDGQFQLERVARIRSKKRLKSGSQVKIPWTRRTTGEWLDEKTERIAAYIGRYLINVIRRGGTAGAEAS